MVYRCILPQWAVELNPNARKVLEGEFTSEMLHELNSAGYNIYFLPNCPSQFTSGKTVEGSHIDQFNYVFVDMDLKEGHYKTKQEFVDSVLASGIQPTFMVDSGNGVHCYFEVKDLDAMSYLKLQRRLMRKFHTDEAVGQIYQLMRVPGTFNTKKQDDFKRCDYLLETEATYTCEQLDRLLPPITHEDALYCTHHYNKTYHREEASKVTDKLPLKFAKLLESNPEVKEIWQCNTDDRSNSDFRLGHIMFASGFTKQEAASVLVNCAKALSRAPVHRVGYAEGIIEKIWTFEIESDKEKLELSKSVKELLQAGTETLKGTRFPCNPWIDSTEHGFRLGQVIGLVAGSGVGKTAMALNMFRWFVERNPEYVHFFIPLEQPAREIADRWGTMCGADTRLHDKVHIVDNYAEDGTFRHLSFDEIKEYVLKFQRVTGKKIGCIVIDHIGALKKKGSDGENQDLMDICHSMKAFAISTNTMLVMQSQAPREKAGAGDLELNKDAAYGTVYFESYCDYLITIWQPLKRCHSEDKCPTVTSFKFCKIRHKKQTRDKIQEDVNYRLFFDPETEHFRDLTQDEEKSFDFFNNKATNARKRDRKTDIVPYQSVQRSIKDEREVNNSKNTG
jgi:hypothetical protein